MNKKLIEKILVSILSCLLIVSLSCNKDIEVEPKTRFIEGDFYVSTTGDDSNPGTKELPWQTLKMAAENVGPGQIIVVKDGVYNEYITLKSNGTGEGDRITLFSESIHGAACYGFKIQGSYVTIDGFNIEANVEYNYTGIYIDQGAYVDILNCYIHECPIGGIRAIGTNYSRFKDNKIEHNGQCGISIIGSNGLIEGNEISRTVQYHPKGDEPGFTGNDADGLRIFGDNHTIRGNRVYNIADPSDSGNIDPHADCIQTWDGGENGRPIMVNTTIEGNFFSVNHPSGKGIMISALNGNACHHLIVKNNIIEFRDIGISAYNGEYSNIYVYNNVFKAKIDDKPWGTALSFKDITNFEVVNNITVDCHPEHRHIVGGSGVVDYNLAWNSDGTLPTLVPALQDNEKRGEDPLFVKYTEMHTESDYHLLAGSPAIDCAFSLENVTVDFENTSRPHGLSYDIGVFEYHE